MSVRTECHDRNENAILFLSFCIFWPFPRQRYNLSLSPFLPPTTKWLGHAEITLNDESAQINYDLNNGQFSGLNKKKANGIKYWHVTIYKHEYHFSLEKITHLSPCKSLYTSQMNLKFIYRIYMWIYEGLKFDQMKIDIIWVFEINFDIFKHVIEYKYIQFSFLDVSHL